MYDTDTYDSLWNTNAIETYAFLHLKLVLGFELRKQQQQQQATPTTLNTLTIYRMRRSVGSQLNTLAAVNYSYTFEVFMVQMDSVIMKQNTYVRDFL